MSCSLHFSRLALLYPLQALILITGRWKRVISKVERMVCNFCGKKQFTVKILKFGTPQTIAIIVLKIEKFDVTLH